jgi:hypothetical protein
VQGVHTLSDVIVQAVCCWPAEHGEEEQGVHAVAPIVEVNVKPVIQSPQILLKVELQSVMTYFPG